MSPNLTRKIEQGSLDSRVARLEMQFIAIQEAMRQIVATVNVILDETEPVEDGDAGMSGGEV